MPGKKIPKLIAYWKREREAAWVRANARQAARLKRLAEEVATK